MATALGRQVGKLLAAVRREMPARNPLLESLRADPARILAAAVGAPDPWQVGLLRSHHPQTLLLCSRQAGKSTTAAAVALRTALLRPNSLTLLLSPSERQSGELFLKVMANYKALGRPVPPARGREGALQLHLANGSRVLALPGSEDTVVGFSAVSLLVIDEAARVPDALYRYTRPMLAVSRGHLLCLTTPKGRRGWFFDEWRGGGDWNRVSVTADRCRRIAPAFLAAERRALGERWYQQEYYCQFLETVGAVFSGRDIDAMLCPDAPVIPFR